MRTDMHEISDQLERDVNALVVAATGLGSLARYYVKDVKQRSRRNADQTTMFPDQWDARKDMYLESKDAYQAEHEKLTILL